MATSNSTPCTDLRRLQAAITSMDACAQDAFSEISAIAKLAMMAMETPDGYRHPETIVSALRAIWGKADVAQDSINYEAEEVGCGYIDPSIELRYVAQLAASKEAAQ